MSKAIDFIKTGRSFLELELGKIYISSSGLRVVRVDDEYVYVLCTGHFIKVWKPEDTYGFTEYPYGFPKQHLLDEEFFKGGRAVDEQIWDGRAEREVRFKRPSSIIRFVEKKFKEYKMKELKKHGKKQNKDTD